jgi:hypothetical protein
MPEFDDDAPRRPPEELRRIARYQRWVVATILAQLALWAGYVVLALFSGAHLANGLRFPVIVSFVLGAVGGIYAFLIYWTARGPFVAVVMGLGSLPPCLGLLVLAVVHGTATTVLRANGVPVGVFGADVDAIADSGAYDDEDAGW